MSSGDNGNGGNTETGKRINGARVIAVGERTGTEHSVLANPIGSVPRKQWHQAAQILFEPLRSLPE